MKISVIGSMHYTEKMLAARDSHIALGDEGVKNGNFLRGAALLDDNVEMCGSVMLVDFPSRTELDEWLKDEPYVIGKVWKDIDISPVKIGPSFEHIFKK